MERRLFLKIQSIYHVSQCGEHDLVPITKRMEIIASVQVCLIPQMNFDDKENGGKKDFLANPKHEYHVSQQEEHDYSAHNKKNGEYPSLSHFMDEH